jgi:hypothetical protein
MEVSYTSHIRKGLIIAAIIIAINVVGHFSNLILLPWYGFIILTIFIIASFISTWIFNTQTKGYEPFSATLSHGFKTVAVATVLFFVYNFLAMHYFFPGYVTNQIEALKQEALQHGEKMESFTTNIDKAKQIYINTQLAGILILYLLAGGAGALLAAVSAPKKFKPTTSE